MGRANDCALAVVVIAASALMCSFKPAVKLRRHYVITNVAELAPVLTLVNEFVMCELINEHTKRAYVTALKYFIAFASDFSKRKPENLQYSDLNRSLIYEFAQSRLAIESRSSCDLRLRVVSAFCSWCCERYGVVNHALKISTKHAADNEIKRLSNCERERLISVSRNYTSPLKRFVPLLLLFSGLRNSEAVNLPISSIDARREWLNKIVGKSAAPRDVPISDSLRHEITEYLRYRSQFIMRSDSPLLLSSRGTRLNNKTVWAIVYRACEDANVAADLRHPHALRHTYAYNTLEHLDLAAVKPGRALIILRDLLGHRSIQTTMKYLQTDKNENYELLKNA